MTPASEKLRPRHLTVDEILEEIERRRHHQMKIAARCSIVIEGTSVRDLCLEAALQLRMLRDWIEERSKPEPGVTGAGQPADGEAVAEEQQQEELKRCRGSVGDANGRIRCAYCGHTDPCYCQCPGGKYSHDPFSDEGGAGPSAEGDVESQAPGGG